MPSPSGKELIQNLQGAWRKPAIFAVPLTKLSFVVTVRGAANMRERELTRALQRVLDEKVWVTTESNAWAPDARPVETHGVRRSNAQTRSPMT